MVVSDYGYGAVTDEVIERLTFLRSRRPCVLLVDSKNPRRFGHAGATVLTPNHLEARLAVEYGAPASAAPGTHPSGDTVAGPAEMMEIGRRLLATIDADYVAITMAADGVCLCGRHDPALHLTAHPVAQASVAGAGDSFAAAMALALGAGAAVEEAARIGIDAAGIAVTRQWTAVVRQQELLQRVSLRDHAADPGASAGAGLGTPRALALLAARLDEERRAGRTIVFTNGVFDILHAGHVEFLRRARELGDILVVGVNSDRGARCLKGRDRPITGERDRVALVAALGPVDHVVLFDDDNPAALIRTLRPHIHAKGGDYADADLPEAAAVREVGGRVVILPLIGALSTSSVIERIVALAAYEATSCERETAR